MCAKVPCQPSEALWAVAATVRRGGTEYEIGTGLTRAIQFAARHVRLNGVEAKGSAELGEVVQMVWLTPAMDRLFIESASGRRRFLDRLVLGFDVGHARAATRYETAMRERARLLKYGPRDPAWLDGLENEMAEAGMALAAARKTTVARLNLALAERGGAFPAASLSLGGREISAMPTPCVMRWRGPASGMRKAVAPTPGRISPTLPPAIRKSGRMRATAPPANKKRC